MNEGYDAEVRYGLIILCLHAALPGCHEAQPTWQWSVSQSLAPEKDAILLDFSIWKQVGGTRTLEAAPQILCRPGQEVTMEIGHDQALLTIAAVPDWPNSSISVERNGIRLEETHSE